MADKRDVILEKRKAEGKFALDTISFTGTIIYRAGSLYVPGIKNHNWVLPDDENEPIPVYNRRVKPRPDLPVRVGFTPKSKRLEILEVDVEHLAGYVDTAGLDIPAHSQTHKRGGDDPLDIDRRMITDQLYLYPNSGLTVGISPLEYDLIGSRVYFPGMISKDLTSSKPAAGLARWVLVYLDTADNTIKLVNGSTVQDFDWIIPTKPDTPEGGIAAGYVRLDGSQTSIVEADIDDGRRLLGLLDHGALSGLADDDHTQYLLADGSRVGATAQAQDFGANGITLVNTITEFSTDGTMAGDSDSAAPTEKAAKAYIDARGFKTNFPSNDIYTATSLSTSDFVATIATLPGGATLTYNTPGSGDEANLVPTSTSQICKMVLHNTTRGNDALISNCVTGTNTITLTANVPGDWQVGDTITIRSQTNTTTVTGYWVDFEFVSDLSALATAFMASINEQDSGGVGVMLFHPYQANVTSKRRVYRSQVAAQWFDYTTPPIPVISNRFCLAWVATGSNALQFIIRLSAEILE